MPLSESNNEIPKETGHAAEGRRFLQSIQDGFMDYLIKDNQETLDVINEKYRLGEITAKERQNLIDLCIHDYTTEIEKGGPGSGCQGPNCGRPRTGTGESGKLKVETRLPNSFNINESDPAATKLKNGKFIDKFIITTNGKFIPMLDSERHGPALRQSGIEADYDTTTRVIQDLDRKVAMLRVSYPDTAVLNAAIIDGDEQSMNLILEHQRGIAERLYGQRKGMKIILASGGTPSRHNNNLSRDIDQGSDLPSKPESLVDPRFIYKT